MKGVNHTGDQFLQNIQAIIDANMHNENFGVSELASQLGMSRITLHRKVKSVISKSVSAFIRETRLKRALELLHEKNLTVSDGLCRPSSDQVQLSRDTPARRTSTGGVLSRVGCSG